MKILSHDLPWNRDKPPTPEPPALLTEGERWYCPSCKGDLFGIVKEGRLHIKYRERNLIAEGVVVMTCRRCRLISSISTVQIPVTLEAPALSDYVQDEIEDDLRTDIPPSQPEVKATHQAIDYAERHGISLVNVVGTGKDGRVTIKDLVEL